MALKLSTESVVHLVIASALLVFVLVISTTFESSARQDSSSCAASVLVRASTVAADISEPELRGCTTQRKNLSEQPEEAAREIGQAYMRCKAMFGPAQNADLIAGQDTFCHVCGVYRYSPGGAIEGVVQELNRVQDLTSGEAQGVREVAGETTAFPADKPIGVIFVQDKKVEGSWFETLITDSTGGQRAAAGGTIAAITVATGGAGLVGIAIAGGAGAISAYFGGFLADADSTTTTGVVVRPYDAQNINRLGCTRVS